MASISSSIARVGIHSGEEVKLLIRLCCRNCVEYVLQGAEPVLTLRQSAQAVEIEVPEPDIPSQRRVGSRVYCQTHRLSDSGGKLVHLVGPTLDLY
jgi:hypothetical protein